MNYQKFGLIVLLLGVYATPVFGLTNAFNTPVGRALNRRHETHRGNFHNLLMVSRAGSFVVLDNGSIWSVAPDDTNKVRGWMGPAVIHIRMGGAREGYFATLTNVWTGDVVHVRRITKSSIEETKEFTLPSDTGTLN